MKKVVKNIIIILLSAGLLFAATSCSPKTFTLTYIAVEGGNIIGEEVQAIKNGKDGTEVTAAPNTDYIFTHWSDGETNPTRQDKNVQKDKGLVAFFAKIEDSVKLTVTYKSGEGGYIEEGETHSVLYGQDLTVTAVPDDGYEFARWSDGKEAAERTDENIKAGFTVTAIFSKQQAPIYIQAKYIAGTGGYIEEGETHLVLYGHSLTVIAKSNKDYEFVKWSDGIKTAERTDENITVGFTVTAIFRYLYAGGNGTESNPFLIDSYEQLLNMTYYPNKHYRLISDLDLSEINHKPIFDNGLEFNGSFDGDGHTISNMKINTYTNYPSLFGYIKSGNVKNITLTNVNIKILDYESPYDFYAGAVAGVSYGKLENINASGIIQADSLSYKSATVGGIVGKLYTSIENCHANIEFFLRNISDDFYYSLAIGGVAGSVITMESITIENNSLYAKLQNKMTQKISFCSAIGSISANSIGTHENIVAGGLIGRISTSGDAMAFNIMDCFTDVIINCDYASNCAGLIGFLNVETDFSLANCYTLGDVIIQKQNGWVGGVLGQLKTRLSGVSIENCYAEGDIAGSYAGGFAANLYANRSNGSMINVSGCYAIGNVYASAYGGGFAYSTTDSNIYHCYATGNVRGMRGAGFILVQYCENLIVEECFSTGDVIAVDSAGGFIWTTDATIINCYSRGDIYAYRTSNSSMYGGLIAAGFITMPYADIINSFCTGKILKLDENARIAHVGGFIVTSYYDMKLLNCHWLKYEDGLAENTIGLDDPDMGVTVDVVIYNNISEMYSLTDTLNSTIEKPVWIEIANDTPRLKYFEQVIK